MEKIYRRRSMPTLQEIIERRKKDIEKKPISKPKKKISTIEKVLRK